MNNNIKEFPLEVIQELKYYVYRLIDPRNGETFYVGKGKGNRVFQHIKCLIPDGLNDDSDIDQKLKRIREITNTGLNVIHIIHRHGMDEEVAIEVEAALIDAYPGITNLMRGSGSNDFGPMNSIEIIQRYSADEAVFKHKVVMITINRTATERGIYRATNLAWKVNKNKVEQAEFVLSVIQGMIVGVFKPLKWMQAIKNNFIELVEDEPTRYGFEGIEAETEIKDIYLGKRVPDIYRKKGAANPIKYSY